MAVTTSTTFAIRSARTNTGNPAPVLVLYLIGVWMMVHWYHGIQLDAVLYAGQALARLHPEQLGRDVFFAYGSQDDYTLFTPIYAALAAQTTLGDAALLLVGLAHASWVGAMFFLARQLAAGPALWLGLVLVFGTPGVYGAERVLSYGEGLATARIWGEAFALVAVAASLSGRRALAVIACGFGLAMHPIIALPAAGFIALHALKPRHIGLLALAGVLAAISSSWLGLIPAERFVATMDPLWYAVVTERSPYLFLDHWPVADLNEAICLLAVLAIAALSAGDDSRRAWWAMLLTGIVGLALAGLGSLTHHALLLQIQPWRVLWLVRIFAALAACGLLLEWWPKGRNWRLVGVWLAVGWLARDYGGGLIALGALLAFLRLRTRGDAEIPRSVWLASWAALAMVALISLVAQAQQSMIYFYYYRAGVEPSRLAGVGTNIVVSLFGAGIFSLLLIPFWHLARGAEWQRWAALSAAAGFALFAATGWNQRPERERDLYSFLPPDADRLADPLPSTATVYWEGAQHFTWVALHRPNYASKQQSAGVLFSRATAIETKRRLARLAKLGTSDSETDWRAMTALQARQARRSSFDGLIHVCHDPVLDYVVLKSDFGRGLARPYAAWDGRKWYLYDCTRLRRELRDPFGATH